MRAAVLLACLAAMPAWTHETTPLDLAATSLQVAAGAFTPLQMSDGSQQWRWAGKQLKGEDAELRYSDVIAQAMGKALWCPRGWEETKRTPASGLLVIEGRCK